MFPHLHQVTALSLTTLYCWFLKKHFLHLDEVVTSTVTGKKQRKNKLERESRVGSRSYTQLGSGLCDLILHFFTYLLTTPTSVGQSPSYPHFHLHFYIKTSNKCLLNHINWLNTGLISPSNNNSLFSSFCLLFSPSFPSVFFSPFFLLQHILIWTPIMCQSPCWVSRVNSF